MLSLAQPRSLLRMASCSILPRPGHGLGGGRAWSRPPSRSSLNSSDTFFSRPAGGGLCRLAPVCAHFDPFAFFSKGEHTVVVSLASWNTLSQIRV